MMCTALARQAYHPMVSRTAFLHSKNQYDTIFDQREELFSVLASHVVCWLWKSDRSNLSKQIRLWQKKALVLSEEKRENFCFLQNCMLSSSLIDLKTWKKVFGSRQSQLILKQLISVPSHFEGHVNNSIQCICLLVKVSTFARAGHILLHRTCLKTKDNRYSWASHQKSMHCRSLWPQCKQSVDLPISKEVSWYP